MMKELGKGAVFAEKRNGIDPPKKGKRKLDLYASEDLAPE
jgi:hypothetical protein